MLTLQGEATQSFATSQPLVVYASSMQPVRAGTQRTPERAARPMRRVHTAASQSAVAARRVRHSRQAEPEELLSGSVRSGTGFHPEIESGGGTRMIWAAGRDVKVLAVAINWS